MAAALKKRENAKRLFQLRRVFEKMTLGQQSYSQTAARPMTTPRALRIRLYGPFAASFDDGTEIDVRGSKIKGLLALLATAPDGARTRAWLQDMLWSLSGQEHGRASLRQALRTMRQTFGDAFDEIFETSNEAVRLRPGRFQIVGEPLDGELLEGLDINEEGFDDWLRERRQAPQPSLSHKLHTVEKISPVVAVIPFLSLDPKGQGTQLAHALAQDIIRTLAGSQFLNVVSHLSSANVHPEVIGLTDLRDSLGADYVVCGSIRTHAERYRLDIDFINAASGQIRFTRHFVGDRSDFLAGNDETVRSVTGEVFRAVLGESVAPVASMPLPSIESHMLLMSGITMMHRQTLGSFSKARACIEEVIRRSPGHSVLHAWLANWYILGILQGWSTDPGQDTEIARASAQRALDLNPTCSFSLVIDGFIHNNLLKRLDESEARYEEALSIDPNNALGWLMKGTLHAFRGEGDMAVALTDKARALSPLDPHRYFFDSMSATARISAGDYETALMFAERSLHANRRHVSTLRARTVALERLGRHTEAQQAASELIRRDPSLTVRNYLEHHPAADFTTGRDWGLALQQAGVPAH